MPTKHCFVLNRSVAARKMKGTRLILQSYGRNGEIFLGLVYKEVKYSSNVTWRDAKTLFGALETVYGNGKVSS